MERCGALMHNHFQMVVKRIFSSLRVLNKKIKVCLARGGSPPVGHALSCKRLRDGGLHTFLGMVGYCMKDKGEEHFEFVHRTISMEDMNEGKLEYAKFRKFGLNSCETPYHRNILKMAHQWAQFPLKKPLGFESSGPIISHLQEWAILHESNLGHPIEIGMYRYQESRCDLKIMMNPYDIVMEDIYTVLFILFWVCLTCGILKLKRLLLSMLSIKFSTMRLVGKLMLLLWTWSSMICSRGD